MADYVGGQACPAVLPPAVPHGEPSPSLMNRALERSPASASSGNGSLKRSFDGTLIRPPASMSSLSLPRTTDALPASANEGLPPSSAVRAASATGTSPAVWASPAALALVRKKLTALGIAVPDTFAVRLPPHAGRNSEHAEIRFDNTVDVLRLFPPALRESRSPSHLARLAKLLGELNRGLNDRPFYVETSFVARALDAARGGPLQRLS